jgi:alkyl sulfatase BDS1-like metallo-beta-lactamase superfamily hydrolase
VRGVVDEARVKTGEVSIIAPQHLVEEAVSENVIAGAAMGRRATFQFGTALKPGPQGQIGSGIGPALSSGEITLIAPTDSITRTGETRIVDGVELEFQMVSGSEAPSELNVYIVPARAFLSAEMSTCSMHNILTPRGAKVRDTRAWAGFLDEAVRLYGQRSDVMLSSHCWPRFGQAEVARSLAAQRDNYRYLHDQTVRLMNQGATQAELAEALTLPPALAQDWFNHGYYGTYNHNAKAIYQFYLGWYDANPANLHPHPPAERARRLIAAMGGAKKAIAAALKAMEAGDYRWSSDLLNQVIFADPANQVARALLADSYEQQGYQAESAIWRNQFLMAAQELRAAPAPRGPGTQGADVISAVPTQLLLDSVATRFDPARAGGRAGVIALILPDRKESGAIELTPTVMLGRMNSAEQSGGMTPAAPATAHATLTGPRRLLLGLLFLKLPLAQLEAAGLKVEGDRALIEAWLNAIDPVPGSFTIAEP